MKVRVTVRVGMPISDALKAIQLARQVMYDRIEPIRAEAKETKECE